jgi:3-deoxy-D-manno-octulosonic acid kinase
MREAQARFGHTCILYDADTTAYAQDSWFDSEILAARGWLQGFAAGRGDAQYFCCEGTDYVLRHYRRGGRVATLLDDRYLWTGIDRTRAWREWRMLARLTTLGLPVPRPFAARVIKSGPLYRADLITVRLQASVSLAGRLKVGALPPHTWHELGRVVRRFHDASVWHADLNAYNVLVNMKGDFALVDFDRARFRRSTGHWREANLKRLLRSLMKLKRLNCNFNFHAAAFESLREGYHVGGE